MGFFDFLHGADINEGVELFRSTPGALLLDVRTAQEYAGGHIPGSVNIPLQELERAKSVIPAKDTPVFVHCLSGARSRQAAAELKHMGYSNVQNIGGISAWRGEVQK
ncbi:MAG: rhodanese-like domain-containing protein [Oscillospiraceae bacterium]|nr:rhodanese-like domain-containing protein [Oscillospiraceae bacterium]